MWRTKAIGTAPAIHVADLMLASVSGAPPAGDAMLAAEDFDLHLEKFEKNKERDFGNYNERSIFT